MKKVLVISSSPRKHGNSDILADEFIRGAKEAGNVTFKVLLRDCQMNFCRGCGACNTTHKCVQKDDMAGIIEKMISADVIVLATPVYFYSPDGQMKTFIDRCVPRYEDMANKEFYYIATAADNEKANLERTFETLRGFTLECLPGAKERGIVYGTGVWREGEVRSTPAMAEAYSLGKNV